MTETQPKSDALAVIAQEFQPLASSKLTAKIVDNLTQLDVGMFELGRIRVPAGGGTHFELETLSGPEALKTIDVVIVGVRGNQKTWWLDKNPAPGTPPSCASEDGITGIGVNSLDPDAKPGRHDCATCHWNQFESTRGEGEGKDCRESMVLFVLRQGGAMPNIIMAPAGSLKSVRGYMLRLVDNGKSADEVVTRVSLRQDKNTAGTRYSVLEFSYVKDLPSETATQVEALRGALLTMRSRRPIEALEAAPEQKPADPMRREAEPAATAAKPTTEPKPGNSGAKQ